MLDVLYVVSGSPSDQRLFKRLRCSVESVLLNDYRGVSIGICDTSPVSIGTELRRHLDCDFRYLHRQCAGDYNKSFNINLAVRELAVAEHFMLTDVDIVFGRSHIAACFSLVDRYPVITYVTHALKSEYYSADCSALCRREGERIPTGGGFFARRDAFLKLNGFDEAYFGWGAEDTDFYDRAERLFPTLRPCEDIRVAHLWHPVNDPNRAVNESRNRQRYFERAALIKDGKVQPWEIRSCLRS